MATLANWRTAHKTAGDPSSITAALKRAERHTSLSAAAFLTRVLPLFHLTGESQGYAGGIIPESGFPI